MRNTFILMAMACATATATAQSTAATATASTTTTASATATTKITDGAKAFRHLELGVTLGTTGIGVDAATPLGSRVKLRTGLEVMPHFERTLHFGIQSFGDDGLAISESRFDRMADFLEAFTGYRASSQVDMIAKPTMWNFKLLVDIYPFRNKHWHLTAGFHWGPSKIGEALNAQYHTPSLFAVNMYNHLYYIADQDYNHDNMIPLYTLGNGIEAFLDPQLERKLIETGRMGIHLGDYVDQYMTKTVVDADGNETEEFVLDADGNKIPKPYRMEPNAESEVSAKATTNSFKPYLGFGYEGRLTRKDDGLKVGFDCGLMFWGGTPQVITHDGTNLTHDVRNIGGQVGDYISLLKGFKVFPVVNLRISKTLF